MSMNTDSFWDDMQDVFHFALGNAAFVQGQHACYCLKLLGPTITSEDSVLIKAVIDDEAQLRCSNRGPPHLVPPCVSGVGGKVILRATVQDYQFLLRHVTSVRVLQAFTQTQQGVTIIDATCSASFFAGHVPTAVHESLRVAEVFAGGFSGWSRAAATLRQGGIPLRVSWSLERDPACWPLIQAVDSSVHLVSSPEEIEPAVQPSDTLLLAADFHDGWWHRVLHQRPVDLAVISPPCQPWSLAGKSHGFRDVDGMLLLHVVELLRVASIPAVAFEEVAGFARHEHFEAFMRAMHHAGFACVWKAPLELGEVGPATRKRFFLLFADPARLQFSNFTDSTWRALGFPSLVHAQAFFPHLPSPLLQPCVPTPEVLQLYLDPHLLPRGPQGRKPPSVRAARIRSPTEQASCFLAAYHYQHELPQEHLLSKGLLGSLLETPAGLRFYSSPEIAVCQGANGCCLIPHCDRTAMRVLGNSLATQHAAFVLGLAAQLFPAITPGVDAASCVELCQASCIRSPSALLLELADGWLLCDVKLVPEVFARHALKVQVCQRLLPCEHAFRPFTVAAGEGHQTLHFVVQVSQHFQDSEALQVLQLVPDVIAPAAAGTPMRIDCPEVALWPIMPLASCRPCQDHALIAWSDGECFLLHRQRPDAFHQLRQVFAHAVQGTEAAVACFDMAGSRQTTLHHMPAMIVVAPFADSTLQECPWFPPHALDLAAPAQQASGLVILAEHSVAADWYLSFPTHLLSSVGWRTHFSPFPALPSQCLQIEVAPQSHTAFSAYAVRLWLRNLAFLAPLRVADELCQRTSACAEAVPVEIQVSSLTLWHGRLPSCMLFADVERTWTQACKAMGCRPDARVFSGPHPVAPPVALQDVSTSGAGMFRRRKSTGVLLVTVMPCVSGGGAKDSKTQLLRSRLAQICLDQGLSLPELNRLVTLLTQKVATSALQHAADASPASEQWSQLQRLMQEHAIPEPDRTDVAARSAHKISSLVKRRHLFQDNLRAADFNLAGGFFANADGTPATILRRLLPNTSGVILLDHDDAQITIRDFHQGSTDEVGVVCLGHTCPDPGSCTRKLSFPAHAAAADGPGHVLLAGCLHDLGARSIQVDVRNVDRIDLAPTVPCTLQAHADEWDTSPSWQELTQSPVKLLLEQLKHSGISLPAVRPWARVFKLRGRPATPAVADFLQFNALIPAEVLQQLMRLSGYQGVYITPRDDQGRLRAGWSVVWLSADRSEVARVALGVPTQCGLVRAGARYGIRVPEADFADVFKKLKPDQVPKNQLSIQHLFKLCPTPLGTTESSLLQWAEGLSWQIKVIKALGPRQWLIGSACEPPTGWLAFRGETVLTVPVQQRSKQRQVVQAGHQHLGPLSSLPQAASHKDVSSPPAAIDPLQKSDPWRAYNNRMSAPGQVNGGVASMQPLPPRSIPEDGPIGTRFQAQDLPCVI